MAQYDVDLRDYWRIFRKRKSIVILMVLLAAISSYGFAKLKEPKPLFEASASVKIEQVTNLADFLSGAYWVQGENMVTQAFLITSFPVLVKTAKELGWISKSSTLDELRISEAAMAAVQRLKAMAESEQQEGTNIVNIKVVSSDPQEAEKVANAFAEAFRQYNIEEKNRQIFETKAFIEKQLGITSRELKQAEEKLRLFKETHEMIALDTQTANLLGRLTTLEAEYEELERKKAEFSSLLQSLDQGGYDKESSEAVYPALEDSPVASLGVQLRDLVLKRDALLYDYTEKHPQVLEVEEQIHSVVSEIRKAVKALLEKLSRRQENLLVDLRKLRWENLQIPDKALQLARLEREKEIQAELYSQLKAKYQETLIKASGRVEEVSLIRPAVTSTEPINIPSKIMIILTGVVMGLVIGIVFTFVAETLDTSIGTIEDIETLLQVPVLGVIPFWESDEGAKGTSRRGRRTDLVAHFDPKSLAAEAFRSLRTNMQFVVLDKKGKSFLITSSFVQEGKTSNVVNLALSMAQAGDKVLLVEGDLRKPLVHKMFGLDRSPGMTDYVLGNYDWQEIVNTITDLMLGEFQIEEILKTPGLDNLHIVTAGTSPPNPSEILRSPRFRAFLAEVYEVYDYIFIDAPPVLPVADASEIGTLCDGVILVYKVGAIARGILYRAKMSLDNVKAKVVGVILNNVKPEVGPDYFKYHAHYYYGPPGEIEEPDAGGLGTTVKTILILAAAALIFMGIFWQDIFGP
ncbi:MAG: AAA family ATPase [Desulfobacterales bacterium]|nr:AAA family ATPase [Desulfobacterales bacterium]MCF8078442.1 AAA family ATPase [Desulfobacterales bacterium]